MLNGASSNRSSHRPKPLDDPKRYPKREILNGIFYVVRGGIAWRMIPHDLPPHGIVYHYFRQWRLEVPGLILMMSYAVICASLKAETANRVRPVLILKR